MSQQENASTSPPGQSWVQKAQVGLGALVTLIGLISTTLEAIPGPIQKGKALSVLIGVPATVIIVLAILLFFVGCWLITLGRQKKSRLLRPDALRLKADDPEHLKGREEDLLKLVEVCRENRLVFLVGESGAGKSALVMSGLCRPGALPNNLVPIRLDGWGDDWVEGPSRRLNEALQSTPSLTDDQRQHVGYKPAATAEETVATLKEIKNQLNRTPLLIFDQFDDYQARHRAKFFLTSKGVWKDTSAILKANPFWKRIATLVRDGHSHVLIVTRKDTADGLGTVQFVDEPPTFPLDRPSADVVRPLLDQLSRPHPELGPVVDAPESGWEQLKGRIARDLEQDGQVLPIRLRSVLMGIGGLPSLTVTAYERAGSIAGLEAKSIEIRIAGASRHSGLDSKQIIQFLKAMVDEKAKKTVPSPISRLAELSGLSEDPVQHALDSLASHDVVRKVVDPLTGKESWRLDHDYQCQAVLDIEARQDYWNTALRNAHQQFLEAKGNLLRRWRSLLPPWSQLTFLFQRLRGKCRFGEARGYWWRSTSRWLPTLLVLVIAWMLFNVYRDQQDKELARRLFAIIGRQDTISPYEMKECFWPLAADLSENVRLHFLQIALESPENARRLQLRNEIVVQSTVGWNPHMRIRVIQEILHPVLSESSLDSDTTLACASLAAALNLDGPLSETKKAAATKLAEAIKGESNPSRLSLLSGAFGPLAKGLDSAAASSLATKLAEAIKGESDVSRLSSLSGAFGQLAKGLDSAAASSLATKLAEAIKGESDPYRLSSLSGAFGPLASDATADQRMSVATKLAEAIKGESDVSRLSFLSFAFGQLAKGLDSAAASSLATKLAEAIKGESNPSRLSLLSGAFGPLAKGLDSAAASSLATKLAEAIKGESDVSRLRSLSSAFGPLARDATADQRMSVATKLAEAIKGESNPYRLSSLSGAFGPLASDATADQRMSVATKLAEAIKGESDVSRLSLLSFAFGPLAKGLDSAAASSLATKLAEAIKGESDPYRLSSLSGAFGPLARDATADQRMSVATKLAEAIKGESDVSRLSSLYSAFGPLASDATADQRMWVVIRLAEAIKGESDPPRLKHLCDSIKFIFDSYKNHIVNAMNTEVYNRVYLYRNPASIATLAESFEALPSHVNLGYLANFLKYPTCQAKVKEAALKNLAEELGVAWKPGDNPWVLIEHEKFRPYRDRRVVMPPDWPTQ